MVNKKLKVEKMSDIRCASFTKSRNEGENFETGKAFFRNCLTTSKFGMCKKKQKLISYEESFNVHVIAQEETLEHNLFSQDCNDYQQVSSLCATREHFGDYKKQNTMSMELARKVLRQNVNVNVDFNLLGQKSVHLTPIHDHTKTLEYLMMHDDPDSNGKTALHVAAFRRNIAAMELLLRYGADPRVKSNEGLSPMFFAVQSGCNEAIELLVRHGCDVNEIIVDRDLNRQYSYLHYAVERNHVKMVDVLLQYGADVNLVDNYGSTALHLAARDGHLEVARILLERGARVQKRDHGQFTALFLAVGAGHEALFRLLLQYGADPKERGPAGTSLLHLAIKRGELDFLAVLLHHGVDVNAATRFGKTALHYAVAEKNWCALELLLRSGADPNRAEALGKTPLHSAVEARRTEAFELLLRHGADVNARDAARQTPLHAAVKQGCLRSVRTLLHHGAEVDAADAARQTPLHLAARLGHLELFEPLAGHRANIDAADAEGRSALHLAVAAEYPKLLYLRPDHTFFARLLRHGADVQGRTRSAGETPLHLAVHRRCGAFVRALLARGAEVDAEDASRRRTALHLAAENGDAECVEQLLIFGANPTRLDADGYTAVQLVTDTEVRRIFGRHAILRRTADLSVATEMRGFEEESDQEYSRACVKEIEDMTRIRLCEEATYLGFLRASRRSLVMFVRKPEVLEAFKTQISRTTFPLYADMLERNLDVGLLYAPLLDEASQRLTELLGHRLPNVPLEHVLSYLNARDMRCFLEAVSEIRVRDDGY